MELHIYIKMDDVYIGRSREKWDGYCHAPNSKGSKGWEIHPKGTYRFFLFDNSNYRRSFFAFLFHRIRIYNHTKISTSQVRAL